MLSLYDDDHFTLHLCLSRPLIVLLCAFMLDGNSVLFFVFLEDKNLLFIDIDMVSL